MTAEQFAYWLQGYTELNEQAPSDEQWQMIRDHLATVFTKVTPHRSGPFPGPLVDIHWSHPADDSGPRRSATTVC